MSVEGTFDHIDDPVLIGPDGTPIMTWKEGYPYDERMSRNDYEEEKRLLQIELLKLQSWLQVTGHKVCLVFEGRDAAGKGGTIKRFMEHLDPRFARVVALGIPNKREQGQWYFQRWIAHLPTTGEIVLFDRSWYTRAVTDRVMGYCTTEQYLEFLRHVPEFERSLQASDMTVIKLWFSVSRQGASHTFHDPPDRSGAPMEAEPQRPRISRPLARLHDRQGGDVPSHGHDRGAVDRCAKQRQEARQGRGDAISARPIRLPRQGPCRGSRPRPSHRRSPRPRLGRCRRAPDVNRPECRTRWRVFVVPCK